MPYFCYCIDDPSRSELRARHMAEHLAYIETILDKLAIAGPLMESQESAPHSSCLMYQVDSKQEALALLHQDPYYKAGVWKEVTCTWFTPAAGSWIGGTIW